LHAEPVLFRGFDRELTKAREQASSRVHKSLLLNLFERDPPDPIRLRRLSSWITAAGMRDRNGIARLRPPVCCACGRRPG
jgi:hypothetical protein